MELEEFTNTIDMSLKDFATEQDTPSPVNDVSASNAAAQSAVMDGTSTMLDTYRQVKQDLLSPESQQVFLLDQQAQRSTIIKDLQSELSSILGDPRAPFEEKSEAYLMFEEIESIPLPELREEVAYRSLAEDSEPNDTAHVEASRNAMIDAVVEVQEQKRNLQNMINSMAVSGDTSLGQKAGDLAEIMTPFVEWEAVNKIWREVEDKGRLDTRLLGTLKAELFKGIKNVPVREREVWAKAVIDLVNSNEKILFSGSNDLLKLKAFIDAEYEVTKLYFDDHRLIIDGEEVLTHVFATCDIIHKGYVINVGGGWKKEQRILYGEHPEQLLGATITVRYNGETKNKKGTVSLRFPRCKAVHGTEGRTT